MATHTPEVPAPTLTCLTGEFAPSVLWNNSAKQKTRGKRPKFHFHPYSLSLYISKQREKKQPPRDTISGQSYNEWKVLQGQHVPVWAKTQQWYFSSFTMSPRISVSRSHYIWSPHFFLPMFPLETKAKCFRNLESADQICDISQTASKARAERPQ